MTVCLAKVYRKLRNQMHTTWVEATARISRDKTGGCSSTSDSSIIFTATMQLFNLQIPSPAAEVISVSGPVCLSLWHGFKFMLEKVGG